MQSADKRRNFERMGKYVLINFNERGVEQPDTEEVHYQYDSVKIPLITKRKDVIQSIMRVRYPDIDSEFAARINGGEEQIEHDQWREQAKTIADRFENYVKTILGN